MPSFFQDPTLNLSPAEIARAAKAAQARANAALSTGPKTAQGKAISSQNARKHGFASVNPVIAIEDHDAWIAHLSAYMDRFQPADQPESDCVRRAAFAMWRYDRLILLESALFNLEFDYHQTAIDALLGESTSAIEQMAIAFKEAAGDRSYDLCRRYLHSASREYDNSIRTFYLLESKRMQQQQQQAAAANNAGRSSMKLVENARVPNEPTPITAPAPFLVHLDPQNPIETPKSSPTTAAEPKNKENLAS